MIVLAGVERGLSYEAVKQMTIGQVVDFCMEYNDRNSEEKKEAQSVRWADQRDIDAFFGG